MSIEATLKRIEDKLDRVLKHQLLMVVDDAGNLVPRAFMSEDALESNFDYANRVKG